MLNILKRKEQISP